MFQHATKNTILVSESDEYEKNYFGNSDGHCFMELRP